MLPLDYLGSDTVLPKPTTSSRSINSESPHNLTISPSDKQDSKDNGGEDGKTTVTATWHSTTSTLTSPSSSTSTSVCEPRCKSHHTHRLSVSFRKVTNKLSRALPRVKLTNIDHSSSSSSSTFSSSSTSHLLTSPSAHQISTPPLPFRNIYDYSQGPRPLKLKLRFHPSGTSTHHQQAGRPGHAKPVRPLFSRR